MCFHHSSCNCVACMHKFNNNQRKPDAFYVVRWEDFGVQCETAPISAVRAIEFFNKLRSDRGIVGKIIGVAS